jgi:hypothetical protein
MKCLLLILKIVGNTWCVQKVWNCESLPWEPLTGYPNRYPGNNSLPGNQRCNSTINVTSSFYIGFASRYQQRYRRKTSQSGRCPRPVNTYISSSAVRVARSVSRDVTTNRSRSASRSTLRLHRAPPNSTPHRASLSAEQHTQQSPTQRRQPTSTSSRPLPPQPTADQLHQEAPLEAQHNASCVITERVNKGVFHLQPIINCGPSATEPLVH